MSLLFLQHNEDETPCAAHGGERGFPQRQMSHLIPHVPPVKTAYGGDGRKAEETEGRVRTRARKGLTYQQEFNTLSPRPLLELLQTHCCRETDHDATHLNETLVSDGHCECVQETAVSISHRFVRLL